MKTIIRFLIRRSGWVILGAVLVSVPMAYYTTKLYGNLKPDLEELLPRQSRSILDLEEIRSRLQAVQHISILMYSDNPEASFRFVNDLAKKLEAMPKTDIASIEYRIDRELKFFTDRKALFLEEQDLKDIKIYIGKRIDFEKSLYNPLNIFSEVEIPEPTYDFRKLQKKYNSQASTYDRYPRGYYATADEKKRVMFVYLPAAKSGVNGTYAFKKAIETAINDLNPSSYAPDLKIRYAGGAQDIIEEHSALIDDIETSAEIVFVVVFFALVFFFGSWLATGALLASLFMARFWTFGASWFAIGSLNANSAFMGSIVLGSGITFGVMLLSRYLEERRLNRGPMRSAYVAIQGTARATWTAALAAGFAYGSLYFTEFEGFRQYGIMGFMGMVFCWLSSVLVLPALLLTIERFKPLIKKGTKKRRSWIFGPLTTMLGRFPGTILLISIAMTAFSIYSLRLFDPEEIIEKNLANLRNKESMERGSGYLNVDVDEIMGSPTTPVVVLAHSNASALQIAKELKAKKALEGEDSLMAGVGDIQMFIPKNQAQKIQTLREIDQILKPALRKRLDPSDQQKANDLLSPKGFSEISEKNLPPLVREKFREKDGAIGRLVLVDSDPNSAQWSGPQLNKFVGDIRDLADKVEGQKVPVAGTLTVTSDMIASIIHDGPKATFLAFISVVLLIVILFRNLRIAALMLSALILGNLWMFGIILATGLKINFLNFIALPITFGIGVDYGVNIFHRYLHDPGQDILRVVRETGGAVGLCSFTTIIGYSSLLIAQNQAFVSFGWLAVLGEVTSMLAAVLALPALLLVMKRTRNPKSESELN